MKGEFQCEESDGGVSLEKTNAKYDDGGPCKPYLSYTGFCS